MNRVTEEGQIGRRLSPAFPPVVFPSASPPVHSRWRLSPLEALTLEEVFEKARVPTVGIGWPHPGQEDSALRAERVGQAQSPGVVGGAEARQRYLRQVQRCPWRCSWTWERVSSLLWPHFALPPKGCPPGSFPGYHRGQDSPSHLSPSAAVVFTHPFALLLGGCC